MDLPIETELLLLPDGTVLVHNLTPTLAGLLAALNLQDSRAQSPVRLERSAPTSGEREVT